MLETRSSCLVCPESPPRKPPGSWDSGRPGGDCSSAGVQFPLPRTPSSACSLSRPTPWVSPSSSGWRFSGLLVVFSKGLTAEVGCMESYPCSPHGGSLSRPPNAFLPIPQPPVWCLFLGLGLLHHRSAPIEADGLSLQLPPTAAMHLHSGALGSENGEVHTLSLQKGHNSNPISMKNSHWSCLGANEPRAIGGSGHGCGV